MTEDEKRQQKAMLLLECQEAEQHLAHLQEKAKRISQNILAVSKWIENRSKGYNAAGSGEEDKVYVTEIGRYVNIFADPEIAKAMDFEAANSLAIELNEARRRVRELSERKKALGLK
jgi:hypothetical protein